MRAIESRGGRLGEYSNNSIDRWTARVVFCKRLTEIAPQQVRELANSTVPLWEKLCEASEYERTDADYGVFVSLVYTSPGRRLDTLHHVRDWQSLLMAAEQHGPAKDLVNAIRGWLDRYSLFAEWLASAILVNLFAAWRRRIEPLDVRYPGGYGLGNDVYIRGLDIHVSIPPLKQHSTSNLAPNAIESQAEFLERCKAQYRRSAALREKTGVRKAKSRRARSGPFWQRTDWLIEQHVFGRSFARISENSRGRDAVTATAVRQGINQTRRYLGFPDPKKT